MTQFPYAMDYQTALQDPERAFTKPELRQARFVQDSWGLPEALTGTSAVVFHAIIGASSYALRCYTRKDASSRERYAALDSYVAGHQLERYIATVTWHDNAVRVADATWPVLQMEWIDGRILDQYVGYLAQESNTAALGVLAGQWRELVHTLQQAEFAHGDLQHGNVIVDNQRRLRLVDFDSVWIPPLQGEPPPTESGQQNYQHPSRQASGGWGPLMDTFSALVIYLSLMALARNPRLWTDLYSGDNLLFESRDFQSPFQTPTWNLLARVGDAEIDMLAEKLMTCCAAELAPTKTLERTIAQSWWEKTAAQVQPRPSDKAATRPHAPAPRQPAPQPDSTLPAPPDTRTFEAVTAPIRAVQPSWLSSPGAQPPAAAGGPGRTASQPGKATGAAWWQQQTADAPQRAPEGNRGWPLARVMSAACLALGLVLFVALLAGHLVGAAVAAGCSGLVLGLTLVMASARRSGPSPPAGRTPAGRS